MVEIFVKRGDSTDTTVLAANTAILHTNLMTDADRNFMYKNIRTEFNIISVDAADMMILVLASSDATPAEIAQALDNTQVGLDNRITYPVGQQQVRQVWDFFVAPVSQLSGSSLVQFTHQWKLPPKGVPALKGGGLAIFLYNASSSFAFVNGPLVRTLTKSMGGWF